MDSVDPLFILYTSGSTGKPKVVIHTQAGYLLAASFTQQLIFNYNSNDVFGCVSFNLTPLRFCLEINFKIKIGC